jgi:hypothetical protein
MRALFIALVATIGFHGAAFAADPPDKTVRVFYIQPTDVAYNPKYVAGITSVMKSAQRYFMEQCKYTFKLSDPVVEVVKGTHPRSWYETNANDPDEYWWAVYNGREDLLKQVPSVKSDWNRSRWKIVFYIDAEGPQAGGGGGGGWVLLPKHDLDGALIYPRDTARWVGGMVHELGHAFGLPDAQSTDGTVMSASFYGWPNCVFTSAMANTMKNLPENAGFWYNSIPTGLDPRRGQASPSGSGGRSLLLRNPSANPVPLPLGRYDVVGRKPWIGMFESYGSRSAAPDVP